MLAEHGRCRYWPSVACDLFRDRQYILDVVTRNTCDRRLYGWQEDNQQVEDALPSAKICGTDLAGWFVPVAEATGSSSSAAAGTEGCSATRGPAPPVKVQMPAGSLACGSGTLLMERAAALRVRRPAIPICALTTHKVARSRGSAVWPNTSTTRHPSPHRLPAPEVAVPLTGCH